MFISTKNIKSDRTTRLGHTTQTILQPLHHLWVKKAHTQCYSSWFTSIQPYNSAKTAHTPCFIATVLFLWIEVRVQVVSVQKLYWRQSFDDYTFLRQTLIIFYWDFRWFWIKMWWFNITSSVLYSYMLKEYFNILDSKIMHLLYLLRETAK